jgi:hypothetical protein
VGDFVNDCVGVRGGGFSVSPNGKLPELVCESDEKESGPLGWPCPGSWILSLSGKRRWPNDSKTVIFKNTSIDIDFFYFRR